MFIFNFEIIFIVYVKKEEIIFCCQVFVFKFEEIRGEYYSVGLLIFFGIDVKNLEFIKEVS